MKLKFFYHPGNHPNALVAEEEELYRSFLLFSGGEWLNPGETGPPALCYQPHWGPELEKQSAGLTLSASWDEAACPWAGEGRLLVWLPKELWPQGNRPGVSLLGGLLWQGLWGAAWHRGQLTALSLESYLKQHLPQGAQLLGTAPADLLLATQNPSLFPGFRLEAVHFEETHLIRAKEVLTLIQHWAKYRPDQIEFAVNRELPVYLAENLAKKAASIAEILPLNPNELQVEGVGLIFPQGRLSYRYESVEKKTGQLIRLLELEAAWLRRFEALPKLIQALTPQPDQVSFLLSPFLDLEEIRFKASRRGFQLTAWGQDYLDLTKTEVAMRVKEDEVCFFSPRVKQLFAPAGDLRLLSELLRP